MVSGYSTSTNIPQVDGLSTDPRDRGVTTADYCVYFKQFPSEKFIILLLYVDDMLIVG